MEQYEKVAEALSELNVPVKYIIRPAMENEQVGISFHFFSEHPSLYGDGNFREVEGMLQLDIFHKSNIGALPKEAIRLLKNIGYRWYDSTEDKETLAGVRLYHKIMQFSYLESEVV